MKTLRNTLILLAALTATTIAYGQGFTAATYFEYTHISPKAGTNVGFEFTTGVELGAFYQNAVNYQSTGNEWKDRMIEREFIGVYFAYPMYNSRYFNTKLNVRTGVTNGENFKITPAITANFTPYKRFAVGAGIGARGFRPTGLVSLRMTL